VKQIVPHTVWQSIAAYWNKQMVIAVVLTIFGFIFWAVFRRGIRKRVIQLAVAVVATYLLLTAVIIGSGLSYLDAHPQVLQSWWQNCTSGMEPSRAAPGWIAIAARCLFSFPQMSLGLSGFELSMVVLPLIKGTDGNAATAIPARVNNARKLLVSAAVIMSLYLLSSTLVTTCLIPPRALTTPGQAANRALSYLAHGGLLVDGAEAARLNPLFGAAFGTVYDLSTIVILCLAGASVTMGLRELVPQYLHRLGMELEWAHNVGAILRVFYGINLAITILFRASVLAQRSAYATSVLVLMSSAALAAALDRWQRSSGPWPRRTPWGFLSICTMFLIAAVADMLASPDGLLIALCFVLALLASSMVSRALRSMELRFEGFEFNDERSRFLWESLIYMEFPVLIPHRPGRHGLVVKEETIRKRHRLGPEVPLVFVEAELGDASDFYQRPVLEVDQEEGRFIVRIRRCASIPHVLAAAALELSKVGKPPEIHFGWSNETPISANMNFLLFGQGNVPWMVRELIRKAEPDETQRPAIVIG
jgi:hypothetical protein